MIFGKLFRKALRINCQTRPTRGGRKRSPIRLGVEALEDRLVPSTFTVTNLADSGAGSLRDAITQADAISGSSSINFAVTGTIAPQSPLPALSQNIDILGPGPASLTVNFHDSGTSIGSWGFTIDPGETVTISGLTLTQASVQAIYASRVDLTVSNCAITNNGSETDATFGAGIDSFNGTLAVDNCIFSNNALSLIDGYGAAIFIEGDSAATISNSTFTSNVSCDGGGIGVGTMGTLTVTGCTFSLNQSLIGGPVNGDYGQGGAVWFQGGTTGLTTFTGDTFSGNFADCGGGAIWGQGMSTWSVEACNFVGNQTTAIPSAEAPAVPFGWTVSAPLAIAHSPAIRRAAAQILVMMRKAMAAAPFGCKQVVVMSA